MFNNFFFENCALMRYCGKKYFRVVQATDDNMAHAH